MYQCPSLPSDFHEGAPLTTSLSVFKQTNTITPIPTVMASNNAQALGLYYEETSPHKQHVKTKKQKKPIPPRLNV